MLFAAQGATPPSALSCCNTHIKISRRDCYPGDPALLQGWASISCIDYTLTGCRALYCTAPHCTVLYCTALQCILLYCTSLNALYYTELHCALVYCTNQKVTVQSVPSTLSLASLPFAQLSVTVGQSFWPGRQEFASYVAIQADTSLPAYKLAAVLHCSALIQPAIYSRNLHRHWICPKLYTNISW